VDLISQSEIVAGIALALGLTLIVAWLIWRRRRGPEIAQALQAVAIERLQNVLLPD
jgi:hypothetical protein